MSVSFTPRHRKGLTVDYCSLIGRYHNLVGKSYLEVNVSLLVVAAVMERVHFISEETIRLLLAEALSSNHEEADTRLLFHAKHASQPDSRIIIQFTAPDTDVLVLGLLFYDELGYKELWLRTGSKDRLRSGAIIRDGDRKSWDARGPMIWDNFSIFRTNFAILTSYIRADPRTCCGLSRGCCHVVRWNGESCEILLPIFHSDGRK